MTNLLAAITSTLLVTNTEIKWPVRYESLLCPEERIGCLVFHAKEVAVTTSEWRTNVTIVRRIEVVSLPDLGVTKTNKSEWISEVHTPERRVETWAAANPIALKQSSDWRDWSVLTNSDVFQAWNLTFTNTLVYTNEVK